MKQITLYFICFLCLNTGCNKEDNTTNTFNDTWNLVNVSGGIAGVNNNIEIGKVIWTFVPSETALLIQNNSNDGFGLESGTYSYSIISATNKYYLIANGTELGEISINNNEMTIDQNKHSTSSGADGFIFKFEK